MANATTVDLAALTPWLGKGELYLFILSTPEKVPEGAYAPLEASSYFASPEAGKFRGGTLGDASILLCRYTDSPIGPYDELIYVPGAFDNPSGKPHLRITRIYVSVDVAIYVGRKIWNVPKHMARFTFTPLDSSPHSPVKIQVFPPTPQGSTLAGQAPPPFFSAIATPSTWLPGFPFNTRYLPLDTGFVQPPLPASRGDDGDNASSVIGTDQWLSFLLGMKGKAQVVWYTPGGEGIEEGQNGGVRSGEYADGVGFPKFKPWRMGIHVKNLLLDAPAGEPVVENRKSI